VSGCISPNGPTRFGPVAALEPAEQLALVHGQQWQDRERDSEDYQRLDDLNPPGLEKADGGGPDHGLPSPPASAGSTNPANASLSRPATGLATVIAASVNAFAEPVAMPSAPNAVPPGLPSGWTRSDGRGAVRRKVDCLAAADPEALSAARRELAHEQFGRRCPRNRFRTPNRTPS
jgi:hypothetical protein